MGKFSNTVGEENWLQMHRNYIIRGATEIRKAKGERIWIRGQLYSFMTEVA
jgi:hypothetical protein